ncbi:unnamed protein product [Ilex paraguariensis]|uniref:Uncharacterized protein n=1 Tax=Ilex paraguariensis TaxID=185542 RepID=A0ABC8UP42_9AQUA
MHKITKEYLSTKIEPPISIDSYFHGVLIEASESFVISPMNNGTYLCIQEMKILVLPYHLFCDQKKMSQMHPVHTKTKLGPYTLSTQRRDTKLAPSFKMLPHKTTL